MNRLIICLVCVCFILHASLNAALNEETTSPERMSVAVLWFENQTGDPNHACWSTGISGLIRRPMGEINQVRLLSETAVTYAREQAGYQAGDALDPKQAMALGTHIEAQRVIWGQFKRQATTWQVEVQILNVATGECYEQSVITGDQWLDISFSLGSSILSQLGITPTEDELLDMKNHWTDSPVAMEHFIQAHWLQTINRPLPEQYEVVQRALEADPNSGFLSAVMAATLATEGKLEEAEKMVRRAVKLDPYERFSYYVLGMILIWQEEFPEARQCLQEASRLDPDDADARALHARVLGFQQNWNDARVLAEQACVLDPFNAECQAHLAQIYAHLKQRDSAIAQCRLAERYGLSDITGANVWMIMASTYQLLGEKPEAIRCWQRFIELAESMLLETKRLAPYQRTVDRLRASLVAQPVTADKPLSLSFEEWEATLCKKMSSDEMERIRYPFTCTPEMQAWAEQLTESASTDLEKARMLFDGLNRRIEVGQGIVVRTAEQVYALWDDPSVRFWCGDYTVLYVAMARAIGLDAFFTYVINDYTGRVVHHGCAAVFCDSQSFLVDINYRWFGVPHKRFEVKDDLETAALYLHYGKGATIQDSRSALSLDPNLFQAELRLVLEGDPNHVAENLATMPEPDPNTYDAYAYWLYRARVVSRTGNCQKINAYLRKAIAIAPREPQAHFDLGIHHLRHNQLQEARKEFRKSLDDRHPEMKAKAQHILTKISEQLWSEQNQEPMKEPEGP